ncbi:MAG: hypothetical protein V1873_08590 [Verrucomicrobiota bacterium]
MHNKKTPRAARILGLGLDNQDRHIRITRGKNFDIYLGSERTHEHLQETCMKINEKLDRQGRRLEELTRDEFTDLVADVED